MALVGEGGRLGSKPQSEFYTSPANLALLAGVPVLLAIWALLSPGLVLSHEMTWDFLFNLSGAWHLQHGHVAHVDFHDPVGQLNFMLTLLGFELVGPTPFAFLAGVAIAAVAAFASASLAAIRRLPLVPAALFVIFASLLVLMPANVGDKPSVYSFAMSYNRYGWSLLSILALILFLPPRDRAARDGLDIANAALLLAALFYLKVTYFAAGLTFVGLAVLISPHIRARLLAWAAVGGLLVANALAPWNHPYLSDILHAASAGSVRVTYLGDYLNKFFATAEGYAPYAAGLVVAVWMWARGLAPLRLPLAIAGILAIGAFVLSQNSQSHGLPVGIVIAFLLYDQIGERFGATVPTLSVLMIFPLFTIGASALSLQGYRARAGHQELLQVVERTQLKGLAVPGEGQGLLAAFADGRPGHQLLNRARAKKPLYELFPTEYVETLVEAAKLLGSGRYRRGGIVVLDQVNPFPFMLGWPPPRGGNLWSGPGAPVRPADELFAEADHVLIPKFSTYGAWTEQARLEYSVYLSQNFPESEETQSWLVLSRAGSASLPPGVTKPAPHDRDLPTHILAELPTELPKVGARLASGDHLACSARREAADVATAADPVGDDDHHRGDADHGQAQDGDGADIAALFQVEDQDREDFGF
jgi:hypothetical protein